MGCRENLYNGGYFVTPTIRRDSYKEENSALVFIGPAAPAIERAPADLAQGA